MGTEGSPPYNQLTFTQEDSYPSDTDSMATSSSFHQVFLVKTLLSFKRFRLFAASNNWLYFLNIPAFSLKGLSNAPPRSPGRKIVRAHLGDHGHTFVPTKPGINVREALSKAMKLRKLAPETCKVFKVSDNVREGSFPLKKTLNNCKFLISSRLFLGRLTSVRLREKRFK